ncbi:MAG: response regulator [Pseudomonadota bacterium]
MNTSLAMTLPEADVETIKLEPYLETSARQIRETVNHRVLIVHSREPVAAQIEHALLLSGIALDLIHAHTAQEAVALNHQAPVDLALIEKDLPGVDGLNLLSMLWSLDQMCRVPCILIGTEDSAGEAVAALREGASDYLLADDLSPGRLEKVVIGALERSERVNAFENSALEYELQRLLLQKSNRLYRKLHDDLAQNVLTPLGSIYEFISLVLEGVAGKITDEQGRYLAYARGNCEQLRQSVVSETVFRNVHEQSDEAATRCRIGQLVASVVRRFEGEAKLREIFLDYVMDDPETQVVIDSLDFRIVLSRLVAHALRLSGNGSTVLVSVEPRPDVESLEISVDSSLGVFQPIAASPEEFQLQVGSYLVDCTVSNVLRFSLMLPHNQRRSDHDGGIGS